MRIDYEYLKKVLQAFAAAPGDVTDINELEQLGISYEEPRFPFHMSILEDKGFIEQADGDPGYGMQRGVDGFVAWAAVPLRLTAAGHDFLAGLEDQKAWNIVKRDFMSGSIETVKALVKAVTEEGAKVAAKAFFSGH